MKLPLVAPRCPHCSHLEHGGVTCDVNGCMCPEVYFVKRGHVRFIERILQKLSVTSVVFCVFVAAGAVLAFMAMYFRWWR